jgi:hypothetical protein
VVGLSRYRGLLGARNRELIQPFQLGFSTWTQSPSRLVAVDCVPLGAVPRTGALPEGADLLFTPGRCKKTRSRFGVTALGATWGEASAVLEAETLGEGTAPDAPRGGSGKVRAGCAGSTASGEDGSGGLMAAWAGVSDDDCTVIGEDSAVFSAGAFAPGEARKKNVNPGTPNAAMIAVPAIRCRRTLMQDRISQDRRKTSCNARPDHTLGHSRRFHVGRESAHPQIPDILGTRFIRRDVPNVSKYCPHGGGNHGRRQK